MVSLLGYNPIIYQGWSVQITVIEHGICSGGCIARFPSAREEKAAGKLWEEVKDEKPEQGFEE